MSRPSYRDRAILHDAHQRIDMLRAPISDLALNAALRVAMFHVRRRADAPDHPDAAHEFDEDSLALVEVLLVAVMHCSTKFGHIERSA